MSLFFKKKPSDPNKDPQPKKNTIDLTCPECLFVQKESTMAVSTYCRGCGGHYKIENGQALHTPKNPSNPYASLGSHEGSPRLRNADESKNAGKSTNQQNQQHPFSTGRTPKTPTPASHPKTKPAETKQPSNPLSRAVPPTSALVKKAAVSTGFFQSKVPPREVACFECDHRHQAPAEASSTLCPACGAYIGLKDFDIRGNWNQRIVTRGNVTIHKKAVVTGITIRCHDLLVQGNLTGGVDCSGNFTLRSHGKIMGKVRCKQLIIEKRANVEFANLVECEDAIIDGNVAGNFACTGKLHLKKKATLTGDIKVATMAVEEGASHSGRMSIGQ